MAQNHGTLSELAENIARNSKLLDEYISSNGLPQPGFGKDAPIGYEWLKSRDMAQARVKLANDARKLYQLMIGHAEGLKMNIVMVRYFA
jgi:hypothetical protein